MPQTQYKVWHVGSPVGQGVMGSVHIGVAGIAKAATPDLPFVVANELICYNLARAILLPIPPGFIITRDNAPNYASLDFNLSGAALPPADPEIVVRDSSYTAGGILVYDVWVVNTDRHEANLAHDQLRNKVEIFDHSHAFFHGSDARTAKDRLVQNENELGIGGHCLAREIVDPMSIEQWIRRIESVPDFYIKDVIKAATDVGLPNDDEQFCADFLCGRRHKLRDLVRDNQNAFPKIQPILGAQP